jgi:hypothetical protein
VDIVEVPSPTDVTKKLEAKGRTTLLGLGGRAGEYSATEKNTAERLSMNIYNFFVAHPEPNSDLDVAQAYPELRDWISVRGRLERCGGRAGKVIKILKGNTARVDRCSRAFFST